MRQYGIFASRWPQQNATVWTIVNRNEYDSFGRQMNVRHQDGMRYFDLYHGRELSPTRERDHDVLSFDIETHGYGAILATAGAPDTTQTKLMETMRTLTARPLSSYSAEWKVLKQKLIEIPKTAPAAAAPEGMVAIP